MSPDTPASSTDNSTSKPAVEQGDVVSIKYTGTLDNGEVFDSNVEREPLQFTAGAGQVIPGFDTNVIGMKPGDQKKFRLPPEEAYGPRREDLVQQVPKEAFGDAKVEPGMHVDIQDQQGNVFHADIVEVAEDTVTIDLNPHLAGEALTFDVTIVDVQKNA